MSMLTMEISGGLHQVSPIRIRVKGETISHMKLYTFRDVALLKNIAKFFEGGHISESQYKEVHAHMSGKLGIPCGYEDWIVRIEFPSSKNTDRFYCL